MNGEVAVTDEVALTGEMALTGEAVVVLNNDAAAVAAVVLSYILPWECMELVPKPMLYAKGILRLA